MKKLLLCATAAVMAANSLYAQTAEIYPNEAFAGVSPDGKYAVSVLYSNVAIHDLATGKKYEYDEEFSVGNGNHVSNTGIVVGSTMTPTASYWKDGEWYTIESGADRLMSKADGITADGSRIVGAVSPESYGGDYEGLMLTPCYWDFNADGTLGELHVLPYPSKDLTGRIPQYVTAVRVSDDGKTIAGQVVDYSGYVCQPIVYRQNEGGEWSYTLINKELFTPEGFVLPENPGENWPEIEDFMTEEELAAYQQALDDWNAAGTWDYDTYPNYWDYMTGEEYAAYEKSYNEFNEKSEAFNNALYELFDAVPTFEFNNVLMSRDGKSYVTTDIKSYFDPMTWSQWTENTPYVFNIENEDGKYVTYPDAEVNLIVSSITDNGTIFAAKQASMDDPSTIAYILPASAEKFETLYDYMTKASPTMGNWIKENMEHEYEVIDWDIYDYVKTSAIITGIPFANADMSVIVLGVENIWGDWESEDYAAGYGYILYPNVATALNAVKSQTKDAAEYYTIDGRKNNTLVKGLNIVKTANGETKKVVVK